MNAAWALLALLSAAGRAASRCSPTSYYKNCWIRSFPGVFVDVEASQRRGAQLLRSYRDDAALACSRACCLTRNFSCHLAIFHFDTSQENCLHLRCPTLESCILGRRGHAVLYNVTKGVDPDLLVFGKYLTSNVRVLPHHYGRVNASEQLPSDKRHFLHPPPPAAPPPTSPPAARPSGAPSAPLAAATATPPATAPATTSSSAVSSPVAAVQRHPQTTQTASAAAPTSGFTLPPPSTSLGPPGSDQTPPTLPSSPHHHTTIRPSAWTPGVLTESSSSSSSNASAGRNNSAGGDGGQGAGGEDPAPGAGPGWHVAARALLAAVVVCVTVLLSCCCSVLLVVSWRGRRKRMGRYRTSRRGEGGSTRLIKYVLVRERSREAAARRSACSQ